MIPYRPMEEETTIISALSTLPPDKLRHLTQSILSLSNRRLRRLSAVIFSPILFSLALHRLRSLSLQDKTLLIARHLLFSLQLLIQYFHQRPSPSHHINVVKQRDQDAVLLLLLLCEVHQQNPEALLSSPQAEWPVVLGKHFCESALLSLSGIVGHHGGAALLPYVETVTLCRGFLNVMRADGGGEKEGREVSAAVTAVVNLPSVNVGGGGDECVICKEEMREGRDVCELPCEHLFHWECILPWLKKRNTCPCCRFRLPTDDVFGEIERLWDILVKTNSARGETLWCM